MSIEDRLEKYSMPEPNSGCHLWTAALSTEGYGMLWAKGRLRAAHVLAYELLRGPVLEGLELDHLCRIRSCVNPDHLEAVTHGENVKRGLLPVVTRSKVDFNAPCPHGHTDVVWYSRGNGKLQKECLACRRDQKRRRTHAQSR